MTPEINTQDWQQAFIATNLLAIGYNAWNGFLQGDSYGTLRERGVIVCSTNAPTISVSGESFQAHFVPRCRLAAFLNAWLAAPDTVLLQRHFMNAHILQAVDNYNPHTDVVLLLEYGKQASFFLLRNLPITPPLCYEIVCKEWVEFQPLHTLLIEEKI